ncbi:hypothetical protein [Halegenticoccus tardaugens]|uniref:hypothetical protein n=1 Tax=Halegenticoccus tardaugens TaxID=2071624 RepID=UPI00100B89A7|nr:hypothetical protein [Halegenticoccus tardaugens]
MRPRLRSSLLWGLVGALAFLVFAQGYVLLGGDLPVGFLARLGVAALVGAIAAGLTYATEHRLAEKGRS